MEDNLPPVDAVPDEVADPRMMRQVLSRMFSRHRTNPPKIGDLEILGRVGEGAMGIVYAAYDEKLDRKVAVKVLHPRATDTADLGSARLLREAQAMARLTHPNVATIYEVGSTHDGVYLCMEFIRGVSLDARLKDDEYRNWRAVVGVFLEAGRGLVAAHRAGIVHRDFKPQNVMIGDEGAVKVLDFGLARTTDASDEYIPTNNDESSSSRALTRTGTVMGTPAYMAPEQHHGRLATDKSDQFSFCVALYEGLYGSLPFPGHSLRAMREAVLSGRVPPPPAGTSVPPWVFRVIQRGLSLDPDQRHASMEELLTALSRDPIARRRRNVALLSLILAVGASGFALARALEGAPSADPSCDDSRDEMANSWNPERRAAIEQALLEAGRGGDEAGNRVAPPLQAYAEEWIAMRDEACQTHRAAKQSDTLFDLRMTCLDQRRASLDALTGLLATADATTLDKASMAVLMLPHLGHCADAAALTASVPMPQDPRTANEIRSQRESLARAKEHEDLGHFQAGLRLADEAIEVGRARRYVPLEAEGLLRRGSLLMEGGTPPEAESALTEAYLRAIAANHPEVAVEALSKRMFMRGEWMRQVQHALDDRGLIEALFEQVPHAQRQYGVYLNNLGLLLWRIDAYDEASTTFERALEIKRDAFGEGHPEIAFTLANIGIFRRELADPEAALRHLDAAVSLVERTLGSKHGMTSTLLVLKAWALADLGRRAESRALIDRALALQEPDFQTGTARMRDTFIALGRLDLYDRRFAEAQSHFHRALDIATANGGAFLRIQPLVGLGLAHIGSGEHDLGLELSWEALEIARSARGADHVEVATLRIELARAYEKTGQDESAAKHYEAALAVLEVAPNSPQVAMARARARLARVLHRSGDFSRAESLATLALETFVELGVEHGPAAAEALAARGQARLTLDEVKAIADLRRAVALLSALDPDPQDHELATARFALARALGTDPANSDEAVALAHQAQTALIARGTAFAADAKIVETWLER